MGPHLVFNTSSELLPFVAEGCIVTRDLGIIENGTKRFFLLAYFMSLTIIPCINSRIKVQVWILGLFWVLDLEI